MKRSLSLLCPATGLPLILEGDALVRTDGQCRYAIRDGIPDCVYPPSLGAEDARWARFYDRFAPMYDWSERVIGRMITGMDVMALRRELAALIPARRGDTILEVSPGPGIYQPALAAKVGPDGQLAALDLSRRMLKACRQACAKQVPAPQLVQGNAAYLPYEGSCFDGLFHFGGINLFSDPQRALREFARVVRPGGWVVYGDEQFFSGMASSFTSARLDPGPDESGLPGHASRDPFRTGTSGPARSPWRIGLPASLQAKALLTLLGSLQVIGDMQGLRG